MSETLPPSAPPPAPEPDVAPRGAPVALDALDAPPDVADVPDATDAPDADDEQLPPSRLPLLLIGVLALFAAGGTTDLLLDRPRSWLTLHVAFELGMIALSLACAVVLWRGWWRAARALDRARSSLAATRRTLAERQAERDAWRERAERALAGFGEAIDAQFRAWRLTDAEREVALLLLKGYGHKQVAALTGRSERTVRQHAVAVYDKAGLAGRAELAAFFLHDLRLPGEQGLGSRV